MFFAWSFVFVFHNVYYTDFLIGVKKYFQFFIKIISEKTLTTPKKYGIIDCREEKPGRGVRQVDIKNFISTLFGAIAPLKNFSSALFGAARQPQNLPWKVDFE